MVLENLLRDEDVYHDERGSHLLVYWIFKACLRPKKLLTEPSESSGIKW